MTSNQDLLLKRKDLILFSLLCFLELAAVTAFSAWRAGNYQGIFLFGLVSHGFFEIAVFSLVAFSFLALTLLIAYRWTGFHQFLTDKRQQIQRWLLVLSIIGLVFAWGMITIPPDFFGRHAIYYNWLRPFLLTLGLVSVQGWAYYLWRSGRYCTLKTPARLLLSKSFIIPLIVLLLLFTFSYKTGFGLVSDTPLWNVPGVPISGMQMFLIGCVFTILFILEARFAAVQLLFSRKWVKVILPVLVVAAAVLTWGLTPLYGDSLAVEPSAANPQPYPLMDARVHDLGALSILYGDGINFRGYTDKPLYMVILAALHLVCGYDYILLQWVQVFFLSLIPLTGFLLGRKLHSTIFGLLGAVLLILQQRNALVLSRMISSVNVKILVTETFVLLGILVLCLLLFRWETIGRSRTTLLLGGVVGALSLIRLNPLLFVPVLMLVIILHHLKERRVMFSQLGLFLLGFGILFLPWVVSGTNSEGQPFFYVKIRDVIQHRITPAIEDRSGFVPIPTVQGEGIFVSFLPNQVEALQVKEAGFLNTTWLKTNIRQNAAAQGLLQYGTLVASHFVHNITASIIPLPDVLSHRGIRTLAERDYWEDSKIWDGRFSSGLIRFTFINLVLVSLGIAASLKRHKLKGLIPLMVFVVYNLAISVSLTSGGRYIVPIIWVVFYYYALGLVFLLETVMRIFNINQQPGTNDEIKTLVINRNLGVLPALIGLVLAGALVPAANQLVPLLVPQNPAEKAEALYAALGPTRDADLMYYAGTVLYPIYEPGRGQVGFDLFRGYKVSQVIMDFFPVEGARVNMDVTLQNGDPILLSFDQADQIQAAYLFRDEKLLEYWARGKGPE